MVLKKKRMNGGLLKYSILDSFGSNVYNPRVISLSNEEEVSNLFFLLLKYGVDLDRIIEKVKNTNVYKH